MISVFSGETGGKIEINDTDITSLILCTLIGSQNTIHTTSGYISSGVVYIPKYMISVLPLGNYTLLLAGTATTTQVHYYNYDIHVRRRH